MKFLQELINDILGLAKKLIPDADKRKELELAILTLMHNLRSKWMINILTLAWVGLYFAYKFNLVTYTEFDFAVLVTMISFHFGISPESIAKLFKNFKDFVNKKRR